MTKIQNITGVRGTEVRWPRFRNINLPDRHNGRRSDADLEIDEYYADLNGG
jgi:hypothetical protein